DEHEARAAESELAEMHQVPVAGHAVHGGVGAHGRDGDAVARGDAAQGNGGEEQRFHAPIMPSVFGRGLAPPPADIVRTVLLPLSRAPATKSRGGVADGRSRRERAGDAQVPICSGLTSRRIAATTLNAVIRPVRGFSGEGMLPISSVNEALSLSTVMRWRLRSVVGSAQISITVRSGPMPARLNAATTFRFAGKPLTASRAGPS